MGTAQQHQHPGSALLLAMNKVAKEKELYLEITGSKTSAPSKKARTVPPTPGSFPPISAAAGEAADVVNELRHQGLEIHRARRQV